MEIDNIFMHDAVPTWSGFLYQGRIAVYLAIRKINELRAAGKEYEIENYKLEMEKCEDIALIYMDGNDRKYHSIHQVKNVMGASITTYKNPFIQLMLEKGFCEKNNYGMPKAYLHISHDIDKCGKSINELVLEYSNNLKDNVLSFYNDLKSIYDGFAVNKDTLEQLSYLMSNNKNTISINRKEYKNIYSEFSKKCDESLKAISENEAVDEKKIKEQFGNFIQYLEERLYVANMCSDVEIYKYETGKSYCTGKEVFNDIVEQIKIYKGGERWFTDDQFKCLADVMINNIESKILLRHSHMQEGKDASCTIKLVEFKNFLDGGIENYEKNANILALNRIYNDCLEDFCNICQITEEVNCKKGTCRLQQTDYRKESLENDDFIKFCYNLNPECDKQITDRECLHDLLNDVGMIGTVFPIIKQVADEKLIERDDKTHIKVKNKDKVAYVTAISSKNRFQVVNNIERAMKYNRDLVETIFEADQLITTDLSTNSSAWDYSCIEVKPDDVDKKHEDNNDNSIYVPKKPEFIKVNAIINDKEQEA